MPPVPPDLLKKVKQIRGPNGKTAGVMLPVLKKVRQELIVEMKLRGVSNKVIGDHFGLQERRVIDIYHEAEAAGLVEEARLRFHKTMLPKAEAVYNQIFDTPPEAMSGKLVADGYKLKLAAAKHVAEGTGVLGKAAAKAPPKQEMTLNEYLQARQEKIQLRAEPSEPLKLKQLIDG